MGCFLAPVAEAVVVSLVKRALEKKEQRFELKCEEKEMPKKMLFSRKLGWLNQMLWGGSALLAVEHIWHGEVVPWPPFLTAMYDPAAIGPMLHEIATAGVTMALGITAIWGCMVMVAGYLEKQKAPAKQEG